MKKENKPILIKNINLGNSNIYLDTSEGGYEVKKKIENWAPKKENILIPITLDKKYNFDTKFIIKENMSLPNSGYYYLNFGQEYIDIRGKSIFVADIETAKDLQNRLQKESPAIQGYNVWNPIEELKQQEPHWINAEDMSFGNKWADKVGNIKDWLMQKLGLRR